MSRRVPGPETPSGVSLPRIRRDRHGRGMRGPLAPSDSPLSVSRAQRFDDLVIAAVERLDRRWQDQLAKVEFAVEDVPALDDWDRSWVPLARAYAGTGALPARVVVFRRPVETRATDPAKLRVLVGDIVTEQVAELFGVEPEEIDPAYGGHDLP
ncbi:metallopeptidase family protein [Jiangella alba]|uniref:Zinicin-like metallopeptidase n=1 Tax=Jiangella alba TaxID=561176 RepID=A0A1H5H913_9ACTN|nr:metallopeptidase family protein [Jiangella alba]SEE24473.1 Zinicin-like metallopeptidase [Jiangella alba]